MNYLSITLFYLGFFHMHPVYCSVFFVSACCAVSVTGQLALVLVH